METGSGLAGIVEVDPERVARGIRCSRHVQLVRQRPGAPQSGLLQRQHLLRRRNRNVIRMPVVIGRKVSRGVRQFDWRERIEQKEVE